MIKPTVGRVVWFYKYNSTKGHQGPLAAHVCKVHSDSCVNLMVISELGTSYSKTSVLLVQENEEVPQNNYCTWMPYQLGQAAKTEQVVADAAKRGYNEALGR